MTSTTAAFPSIFKDHAHEYARRGLSVFPCLGVDGKRPLIKKWQTARPGWVRWMAEKFPQANIGLIDGDLVTRVDVDDLSLAEMARERFGETKVVVNTPSGGCHFWYRANGERRVLGLDGLKLDILGQGGFGVAPPSVNPSTGGSYQFTRGGLDDLGRLLPIRPGALPDDAYEATAAPGTLAGPEAVLTPGRRNSGLFGRLLHDLAEGIDPEMLALRAEAWNKTKCDPSLPENELKRCIDSALNIHREGRNWCGREGHVVFTSYEIDEFGGDADALMLMTTLQMAHEGMYREFAASPKAMAEKRVIPGWGVKRYRGAIRACIDLGKLVMVHRGGRWKGDKHVYRPSPFLGCPKGTQYNKHALSSPPLGPLCSLSCRGKRFRTKSIRYGGKEKKKRRRKRDGEKNSGKFGVNRRG